MAVITFNRQANGVVMSGGSGPFTGLFDTAPAVATAGELRFELADGG